jgi:hypothetical protein
VADETTPNGPTDEGKSKKRKLRPLTGLDPEEFRQFIETVTPEEFASSLEDALEELDDDLEEDDEEV